MRIEDCRQVQCRSCDAPIVWTEMPSGKLNPIDVRPSADGNVVLTAARNEKGTPVARVLKNSEMASHAGDRFKSHFSTCPNASDHRRR